MEDRGTDWDLVAAVLEALSARAEGAPAPAPARAEPLEAWVDVADLLACLRRIQERREPESDDDER